MSSGKTFFLKVVPILIFSIQVLLALSEVQKYLGIEDSLSYQLAIGGLLS